MHITGNWETREVTIDGKCLDPRPSQKVFTTHPMASTGLIMDPDPLNLPWPSC